MKKLVYLISGITYLTASTLVVLKSRVDNHDIFHLNIKSKNLFSCKKTIDSSLKEKIICDVTTDSVLDKNKSFDYFDIKLQENKIIISPKTKYKIFYKNKDFFDLKKFFDLKNYNNIDILFYKDRVKFLQNYQKKDSLSFDIDFKKDEDYFIDVLNDDLKPVVSLKDANKLDFIKKLYKKRDYYGVIKKADIELKRRNIYSSEILLYKIRSLDKLLKNQKEREFRYFDLENSCNDFINLYPSHKDLVEVLYYKVKSLYKRGKKNQANRIVQNLQNSFAHENYTEKAMILKAQELFITKKRRYLAFKILKDILYSTKYVENALESAYLLSGYYLKNKDVNNADKFMEKILKYDKKYLLEEPKKSYEYAKKFASLEDYKEAVKIATILVDQSKNEELLKNLAYWQEKSGKNEQAYKNYKRYLKLFPNGQYSKFVKERLDKILINIDETNTTKKLKDINNIIKKYSNDPIYKKALIEKVKLFFKNKDYKKVLNLEKELKDINQTDYVQKAAKNLFEKYIQQNDCRSSVDIVDNYKIMIDKESLYKLGECYYSLARYKDALEIAKKYISSTSFDNTLKWYMLAISAATKIRDYTTSIKLYKDLTKIADKKDISTEVLVDLFYSYLRLKYLDNSINILNIIENRDKNNPKLLDLYYELVKYYKDEADDLSLILYAKKLLKLQKKLKVRVYSPLVDILLIKSLNNIQRYKEALSYFADAYLLKNITDSQKAQLLYLAGEISLKSKNIKQAREFFIKCGTDVKNKMWQNLCSESLKLIEDR